MSTNSETYAPCANETSERLTQLAERVLRTTFTPAKAQRFSLVDLGDSKVAGRLFKAREIPNKGALIYRISVESKKTNLALAKAYPTKETLDSELKMARNNFRREADTLYVGSSTTSFHSRLKQHFGINGDKVFALHLRKWALEILGATQVRVDYWQVSQPVEIDESDQHVILQAIEDDLWHRALPAFGRCGGK